ncbi:tetraacyldisaccharide 4'-kinase [Allomuricauda sp. M10]|uniref:tetraacyldisaccharide 4'-kinase n=1 Tax=Allomuricauda sp. M10 TaxID=2683292 RepID=UPI001D180B1D|nr:tetraacyldisaccharide 4'-kinase [Muricauda sp. M10]
MLQLLRKIAFPFSLIYGLVVHVRNFLYYKGVFASQTYETPTICVGNLSVGGTGKTPMTEYLLRMLKDERVAVLSRGYKRKSEGFVLASRKSTVLDLGDEPFQLHRKFPDVAIAVDADRRNGMEQLETLVKPNVVVLDDAFQHRKVKPTFSLLLTAFDNLYVDDWYLPTGNLRDAKNQADRANLIIVTKCPAGLTASERDAIGSKLQPKSHQKVLFASLNYADSVADGKGQTLPLDSLKSKEIALVTGIASPKPLLQFLSVNGIQYKHYEFGDHHHFSAKDIESFQGHQLVLTTEKDFVRLEGKIDGLYYLEVAHHFSESDHAILKKSIERLF